MFITHVKGAFKDAKEFKECPTEHVFITNEDPESKRMPRDTWFNLVVFEGVNKKKENFVEVYYEDKFSDACYSTVGSKLDEEEASKIYKELAGEIIFLGDKLNKKELKRVATSCGLRMN